MTTYHFPADGRIIIDREIIDVSDPDAELRIEEYVKGCYGTTEYPEDMHGIALTVFGATEERIEFDYRCRTLETKEAKAVEARVPQINTVLRLEAMDGPLDRDDVFVSKLDAAGDFVWAKALGGTSDEVGLGIAVDSSG